MQRNFHEKDVGYDADSSKRMNYIKWGAVLHARCLACLRAALPQPVGNCP